MLLLGICLVLFLTRVSSALKTLAKRRLSKGVQCLRIQLLGTAVGNIKSFCNFFSPRLVSYSILSGNATTKLCLSKPESLAMAESLDNFLTPLHPKCV